MQDNAASILPGMPAPERVICGVPGCGKKINRGNRIGFCRAHREVGSRTAPRTCAMDGCGQPLHARGTTGFCPVHTAAAWSADQRAQAAERRSEWPVCAADGCTKRLRQDNKSGRCYGHRYAPVLASERERCPIEGCGKRLSPKNTVGRCEEHKLPRWVARECVAEGCCKKLNVNNTTGFCSKHVPAVNRTTILLRNYGITEQDYDAMLAAQAGRCALCDKPPKAGGVRSASRLNVDHDHETGVVRMLLCLTCNHGLGNFYDDPVLLRRAADYIERFRQAVPAEPAA